MAVLSLHAGHVIQYMRSEQQSNIRPDVAFLVFPLPSFNHNCLQTEPQNFTINTESSVISPIKVALITERTKSPASEIKAERN